MREIYRITNGHVCGFSVLSNVSTTSDLHMAPVRPVVKIGVDHVLLLENPVGKRYGGKNWS